MSVKRMKAIGKLGACLVLAMAGMGNSCPGVGGTGEFRSPSATASSSSVSSTKSWDTAQFIDYGAADSTDDCLRHNNNLVSGGTNWRFPMPVFHNDPKSFFIGFVRENFDSDAGCNGVAATQINPFVTADSDITNGTSFVDGLASFTQLDVGGAFTSLEAQRMTAVVDSSSNATLVYFGRTTLATGAGYPQVIASRYTYGGGAWSTPTLISDSDFTTDFSLTALAVGVDASNNTAVVWVQDQGAGALRAQWNEFRLGLGWRFSGATDRTWDDATETASVRGVDIGFDSYGHGYAVYVTDNDGGGGTTAVNIVRWKGDLAGHFDGTELTIGDTLPMANTDGYPAVYVAPDGAAMVFFYDDVATAPKLMCSAAAHTSGASTMGAFAVPSRFDTQTGSVADVYVQDSADVIEPILAYKGSQAVMGMIKSGTFYVMKYASNGCTWTSLGSLSVTAGVVRWADLSINSSGEIAAALQVDVGGVSRVYGAIYSSGAWSSPQLLDTLGTLSPGAVATDAAKARPSVSIDESGNAVVAFSMNDTTAPVRRRAVMSAYR